jgi:hypothetical protein
MVKSMNGLTQEDKKFENVLKWKPDHKREASSSKDIKGNELINHDLLCENPYNIFYETKICGWNRSQQFLRTMAGAFAEINKN